MKRLLTIPALAGVLLLSGCAASADNGTDAADDSANTSFWEGSDFDAVDVDLPDGRTVTCVFLSTQSISCDWEHAE